jgi:hypothetical protein
MIQYPLNHRRVFDTRDDLDRAPTFRTDLHINLKDPLEALRPSHRRALRSWCAVFGWLWFMLNHADGLIGARQAIERTPNYYQPHLTCAWAHTGLGDLAAAKGEVERAQALESGDILEKFVDEMHRWARNSAHAQACGKVLEALRKI